MDQRDFKDSSPKRGSLPPTGGVKNNKNMAAECPLGGMECLGEDDDDLLGTVLNNQKYCCAHQSSATESRKFHLTFENTSLDSNESCAKQARQICLRFWNFIDSDPNLSNLLKEGQFIHQNQPKEVVVNDDSECRDEDMLRRFGMTSAQFYAIRNGNRQRLQKRREMNAALELKSGQTKAKYKESRIVNKLADDAFPDYITEAAEEMNKFDLSI